MRCPRCHAENRDDSKFCGNCAAPLETQAHAGLGPEAGSLTKSLETPVRVLKAGALIAGKYRIIEEVGAGGMGVVYKAEDLKLMRAVALKFLPPHLMDSPDLKERFLVEAQAAAALSHPNICTIYEVGEDKSCPYIAMEYVEGETLRDRLKKGPLEAAEVLDIVTQVAAGLSEAHGKGIVHRDIKSANIMITAKDRAKIMDFGLAKLRGGSSLTKSRTTLGTVAYMSPEQARGEELDQRTDIWSLGIVLYELLSGKLPFRGDHDQTVIYSILHKEPESPAKLRPGLVPELDHVVGQALTKKAADRYQTMEELREDLAAVAEGLKPFRARPAGRTVLGLRASYVYPALAALLALALGLNVGGVRDRLMGRSDPPALSHEPEKSIAVLPFRNLTNDAEQEYFVEGMHDETLDRIFKIGGLKVTSRTSSMRYKNSDLSLKEIAGELGVASIMEGSVRKIGNNVRITVQLIDAKTDTHLWSKIFERDLSDIFSIQSEIAQAIARELQVVITPQEKARIEKPHTASSEASEAYLKGMYSWRKLTRSELDLAMQYFELALEKDPEFALAWAGIAHVWTGRRQMRITLPAEATARGEEAILKALELDPDNASIQYVLATHLVWGKFDWEGGETAFRKALEINPKHPEAHAYFSHLLHILGRTDEAMDQIEKALEVDPLSPLIWALYEVALTFAGRYEEAMAATERSLQLDPGKVVGAGIPYLLYYMGREEEAFVEWRKDFKIPDNLKAMDEGYAEGGFREAHRRLADVQAERSKNLFIPPIRIANNYSMAGDIDNAVSWLEKAYEMRDPGLPYLLSPSYDLLRDDPRFRDLCRRMNLPYQ